MINTYLQKVKQRYSSGISTEHSYRGDFQILIEELCPGIKVTSEPKRISCGSPDYILQKNKIPIGYIETKDVGKDLNSSQFKEQFGRYKKALSNLIITDYLNFQFFKDGILVNTINIAEIKNNKVAAIPDNFEEFTALIKNFSSYVGQTIKSASKLSKLMAGKARMLENVIKTALEKDSVTEADSTIKDQMLAFKEILIHDITNSQFADIYAQTIAYGMFAGRLHDETLDDFSRQEAVELIPKSNPFLRSLFSYVSGPDIDERIEWIVDELADVFRATDINEMVKNFGKATQQNDPMIHFYETFLGEYNPKLRKSRGVYYTPEPVVNFIVRAVDDILKTEFNLSEGLADTSKINIKLNKQGQDVEKEVHRVQILDPATGTGTFLTEIIKHIYKKFEGQQGIWNNYVDKHLIPRLNGFELLMASYAMCHLKLELLLKDTGYKSDSNQRLNVYLTNSLEEAHEETGTLFASWLSREAKAANKIKKDSPIMIVIGNPPYSGESSNKGKWIMDLMEDYKKEPGGKEKLQERNPKYINDDYVKFLRYGQHYIEKNGEGILAFINPHGFLDNPTFRGMRWNLLKTYDKIYTIDLHGNSNKKEICPDGSLDKNVFDIRQGVSINFFVKTGAKTKNETGVILHSDLYGIREFKYEFLLKNSLHTIEWDNSYPQKPAFLFKPQDYSLLNNFSKGFSLKDFFLNKSVGIQTHADAIVLGFNLIELENQITSNNYTYKKTFLSTVTYRPFDIRKFYNNPEIVHRPRNAVTKHLDFENHTFCFMKQFAYEVPYSYALITNNRIIDRVFISNKGASYFAPLYLYPDNKSDGLFTEKERKPNLDHNIVNEFSHNLSLKFTSEKETTEGCFAPIDILDYIYAVLHSPKYRETYKEFLKIDFPRVPFPKDAETFWKLVENGSQIRALHLMESPILNNLITTFPIAGDHTVEKIKFEGEEIGKVFINKEQYFDQVPKIAWEFYIGGYQPAQKWLKDRKGRQLSFEDILHYQKIIVALLNTNKIMKKIDEISFMG